MSEEQKQREAFEAAYDDEELLRRHPDGSYMHLWLNDELAGFRRGWQAAVAQAVPSVPEGFKLVPVEPTEKMVSDALATAKAYGELLDHDWLIDAIPRYYSSMIAAAPQAPVSDRNSIIEECAALAFAIGDDQCVPYSDPYRDAAFRIAKDIRALKTPAPAQSEGEKE